MSLQDTELGDEELRLDISAIKTSLAREYGDLFAERIIKQIEEGGSDMKFFVTNHGDQRNTPYQ